MGKSRGFTLIELMVTITVMAIIAMMAAPSFGNLVSKKQLDKAARDLALIFGEARGQAISLGKNITIKLSCPTETDPSSGNTRIVCPPNTSTSFSWTSPKEDIELISDAIDVVFTGMGTAKQRIKMVDNPNFDSTQTDSLTLSPPTNANPSKIEQAVPLSFALCNTTLGESRTVNVSKVGTVDSITTGTCS